jgi:hypothetical protein
MAFHSRDNDERAHMIRSFCAIDPTKCEIQNSAAALAMVINSCTHQTPVPLKLKVAVALIEDDTLKPSS